MKLTYRKSGDYFLPNLEVPEAHKIGKYGMLRRDYLRQHRQGTYTGLLLSGKRNLHLEEIGQQADEMAKRLVLQLVKEYGVTEDLKAQDQMRWVRMMNNIRDMAEEIALKELIYS